jgi:hypothetical protein
MTGDHGNSFTQQNGKDVPAARDRLTAASLARLNAPDPATFQHDARFALATLSPRAPTRSSNCSPHRISVLYSGARPPSDAWIFFTFQNAPDCFEIIHWGGCCLSWGGCRFC